MSKNNNIVHIFTDGACKGNPGPGGWGAVLLYNGERKEICGGEITKVEEVPEEIIWDAGKSEKI